MDVSVVIPVYRSETVLPTLVARLHATLSHLDVSFEIILVDDASPDGVWDVIATLCRDYPTTVVGIQLMRNFGQHNALMCGFRHARGDRIVTLDDDLQQAPESIPQLLAALDDEGADLAYGVYMTKRHSLGRNIGSSIVARFYRSIFHIPFTPTSFRAVRRELVAAILRYDLNFTIVDGLLAWNTQRIVPVTVPHHERSKGESGYTLRKLVLMAMNIFTNFSLLPLQCVSVLGLIASAGGLMLGLWYLSQALLSQIGVPGYASLIVAVLVLGGVQLLALGIMGEYLGRLHLNMNRKPQYTVRRVLGHSKFISEADALASASMTSEPLHR